MLRDPSARPREIQSKLKGCSRPALRRAGLGGNHQIWVTSPLVGPVEARRPANHRPAHGRARASPNPPLTKGLPNRFGQFGSATLGSEIADFPSSASNTCTVPPFLTFIILDSEQLLFSSHRPFSLPGPETLASPRCFAVFLALLSLVASKVVASPENSFQVSYDITTSH